MTPLQRLEMEIADFIIDASDRANTMTQSDLQGVAMVDAKQIIAKVASMIQQFDYDLEDLQ